MSATTISFVATPDSVRRVIDAHPDLCANGFRYVGTLRDPTMSPQVFATYRADLASENGLQQIATTCEYLRHFDIRRGSYGLKHDAENWGRDGGMSSYVTNGSAIIGAILSGYEVVRERNSPNCTFKGR